jgi:hypothetical protein
MRNKISKPGAIVKLSKEQIQVGSLGNAQRCTLMSIVNSPYHRHKI